MNKFIIMTSLSFSLLTANAGEQLLGEVVALKRSHMPTVEECQATFKQLEGSSYCNVEIIKFEKTDQLVTASAPAVIDVPLSNGRKLHAIAVANVEGYYRMVFERKDADWMTYGISIDTATPLMSQLISKLENGEFSWTYYHVRAAQ